MSEHEGFQGFPREGLQFLYDLAENNNREWFQDHKSDYQELLLEPGKLFVRDLGERLQTLSPGIISDTRTNGSGTIMRIYRDVRFSKDKTPYNTQMRFFFWEGKGKKMENPGFYLCFDGEKGNLYSGYWHFPKPKIELFRDAVMDEEMGPALEKAILKIGTSGNYTFAGEQYKRIPKEFDPLHDRAYLLKYKGLFAGAPVFTRKELLSEKLVDICFEHCRNMAPLHDWLVNLDEMFEYQE